MLPPSGVSMNACRIPIVSLLAILTTPLAAEAKHSDWTKADQSQTRLLLTRDDDGQLWAGLEIILEPGWYTYWRTPGEAGVPPIFDFSGSENVADVEVRYPAPERRDDGTSVSLIYQDEVVFPLEITPVEPDRPLRLRADVTYGVCREVCIPTSASVEIILPPGADFDPLSDARLSVYERRVPGPPQPGRFDIEGVALAGDVLEIETRMPDSSYIDLFSEPPEGWFIGQPKLVGRDGDKVRWTLSLAGRPRDIRAAGQTFQFVAVAGDEAIAQSIEIP